MFLYIFDNFKPKFLVEKAKILHNIATTIAVPF